MGCLFIILGFIIIFHLPTRGNKLRIKLIFVVHQKKISTN
jgi:hypothetical protein